MSPLSQVKRLALGDLDDVRRMANQSFLNQQTAKQVYHHEISKRTLGTNQGSLERSSKELVDPIGYFENRYFPIGEDELHLFHRQKQSLPKVIDEKDRSSTYTAEGPLDQINEFEKRIDQATDRVTQASIEMDFDMRT